jgi:hypothetical protein
MLSSLWQTQRCVLGAFVLIAALPLMGTAASTDQPKPKSISECAALLASVSDNDHRHRDLAFSGISAASLAGLRSQVEQCTTADVVVYAFLSEKSGVAVIRFETHGPGMPVTEEVVSRTMTTADTFRQVVDAARQPDNAFAHNMLRNDFAFAQESRDQGKLVFLMDTEGFGLLPQSFALPDATLFASGSLNSAIANVAALGQPSKPGLEYAALFGLPHTEAEYLRVFGHPTGSPQYPPLESWRPHWETQQQMIQRHQLKVLAADATSAGARKKQFLAQLRDQVGIVMIIAHAEGAEIRLADSQTISLSPADIASLHFTQSPFIFLRVCQGKDEGFADAFLKAGAAGVWANRGLVKPEVANAQAAMFLQKIRAGTPVITAIRDIQQEDPHAKNSDVLFTRNVRPGRAGA